jgi:hypothetical protein
MGDVKALTDTLYAIRGDTGGDTIDVEELIGALDSRGYGPLLMGPALISLLPTGALPGVPAICAVLIILVSVQILIGRSQPWVPKRFQNMSFSRDKFLKALDKAEPYTKKIDTFIYPRFKFLIREELKPVIAFISILLSIAIMILGFIPFLAMLPASGILLLGMGLSGRDGLLLSIAFAICVISLGSLPYAWSIVF